jgi:hypothetical protein
MSIASGKENRRRVAKEVIKQVMEGKKINISQGMRNVGYAKSTVNTKSPEVRKSVEFQEETMSFINQLEEIVQKDLKQLNDEKRRNKMTPRDNIESVDKLTKLKQLLTGGVTSNEKMTITWDD